MSREARGVSLDLVNDGPDHLRNLLAKAGPQPTLDDFRKGSAPPPHLTMPRRHAVLDIDISDKGWDVLRTAYELQPTSYEELVSIRGMGPQKVRALALVADVIYGVPSSWKDPVKYSFAHGGKDGYPYPVNDDVYQNSIRSLREAVESAKVGRKQKLGALKRLPELI